LSSTTTYLAMSLFMRSVIASGVLPGILVPSLVASPGHRGSADLSHGQGDGNVVSSLHCMNDLQPEGHMASYIGRRKFLATLGGAAVAWPLVARAQQPALPVVGFMSSASSNGMAFYVTAFRNGLKEVGYVEGRNIAVEYRWAEEQSDRLPALASDLVSRQVAAIFADSRSALAAKSVTTTIPIVFSSGGDPVELGLVTSLNRPGGNVTGVSFLVSTIAAKRLELLHELVPTAGVIGYFLNPDNPLTVRQTRDLEAAARALGLQLHLVSAHGEHDFEQAFAQFVQHRVDAVIVGGDPIFLNRRDQVCGAGGTARDSRDL
jgi:putative ABC transport system substrate-binding protein